MPDQPELLQPTDAAATAVRGRPRRERRTGGGIPRLPWRRIVNPFAPVEILSQDHVEAIHRAGLRILREVGVEVLGARALDQFERAGATVTREASDDAGRGAAGRVRLEPEQVEELVAKAPSRFELYARNPEREPRRSAIATWSSAPSADRRSSPTSSAAEGPATSPTSRRSSG